MLTQNYKEQKDKINISNRDTQVIRDIQESYINYTNPSNVEVFFEANDSLEVSGIDQNLKNFITKSKNSMDKLNKFADLDKQTKEARETRDKEIKVKAPSSNFSTMSKTDFSFNEAFHKGNQKENNSRNLSPITKNKSSNRVDRTYDCPPISMKINNNIASQSKINYNFNININCETNNKDKMNINPFNTNNSNNANNINNNSHFDKNKSTNSIISFDKKSERLDTIYEIALRNTDKESECYYEVTSGVKQNENIFSIKTIDKFEDNEKESVVIGSISTLQDFRRGITQIKFNLKNELDFTFLRQNLKIVHTKNKQVSSPNRHFKTLLELQNFEIDTQQIWIIKISFNSKYLATGGKSGVLKIFEILNFNYENYKNSYSSENIFKYLHFINEKPLRVYNDHSNDIIDLSWSPRKHKVLLTASLDHLIIMWNVDYDYPIAKFNHSSIVTCVCFYPNIEPENEEEDKFVSGCLDKYIRIWSITKNKVIDYTNIKEYITSISYLPTGDMLVVGTHNGRCSVFDCQQKLKYNFSFTCRNRMGKFSYGRKITNISFINRTQALITTNDSRIRLINISDGKLIQKYKAHINQEYMIRAFSDDSHDLVISASEDGFVYVWSRFNQESSNKKNYNYEFYRPFSKDTSSCSFIVNDECQAGYLKKLFNLTCKIMINSIVINASVGGRLQVLINCADVRGLISV